MLGSSWRRNFLFYILFEAGLIRCIGSSASGVGRTGSTPPISFFLYTLLGSVLMPVAMLWMVNYAGTSAIPELMATDFPAEAQHWLWLAFCASFAVKMPMWASTPGFPTRTSSDDPRVGDPRGVLLKRGGYGFVRFRCRCFLKLCSDDLGDRRTLDGPRGLPSLVALGKDREEA